jgi:hypothetical protein
MKLPWILLAVATLAIVLMIRFWPNTGPSESQSKREDAYRNEIAILKSEKAQERAEKDSIKISSKERIRKDSIALKAQESKTRLAVQRAKEAEARIPKEELTPAVVEALAAKDTVIASVQAENDSLRASLYDTGKEFIAYQESDINEDRIEAQMFAECEARRAELLSQVERMEKKNRKKVKIWQAVAIVGTAGAFLLGAQ